MYFWQNFLCVSSAMSKNIVTIKMQTAIFWAEFSVQCWQYDKFDTSYVIHIPSRLYLRSKNEMFMTWIKYVDDKIIFIWSNSEIQRNLMRFIITLSCPSLQMFKKLCSREAVYLCIPFLQLNEWRYLELLARTFYEKNS